MYAYALFASEEDRRMDHEDAPKAEEFLEVPPNPDFVGGVASKDLMVDESLKVWVRIFLPQAAQSDGKKHPVVLFYHGGGFVLLSPAAAMYQKLCERIAKRLGAIVVSVKYRLAAEHRLPAAYDDGFLALTWLQAIAKGDGGEEPWLKTHADFSRILLAGDSAGGNLVHHVTVRAAGSALAPLKLVGQVLIQPFFGGVARTPSELKLASGPVITQDLSDDCWKASLPEGADRDHRFCNVPLHLPTILQNLDLPKTLVVAGGVDLLHDRQVEYVKLLEEAGKDVQLVEYEAATHAFYINPDIQETTLFLAEVAAFAAKCH